MRRVVYTVVTGNYDTVFPIKFKSACNFLLFTDNSELKVEGWETIPIDPYQYPGFSGSDINRNLKIIIPKECHVYDQSLYLDGHVKLNNDPAKLFDEYLEENDIA